MDKTLYLSAKKRNKKIFELLEKYRLPTYNGFAFADAFYKQNDTLCQTDDYLILLALLWSPNDHLFSPTIDSAFVPGIDIKHASIKETASLGGFKILEPEKFETYCSAQKEYQVFLNDVSASSQIFKPRFNVIRLLLLKQRRLIAEYHVFLENYKAKIKDMPDEIKSLLADETVNDLESKCLITFMDITLEYIRNLRTNPKNRSKYEAAQQRLERYVDAARVADFTEEEPEALDDIIGSLFERLLKVAAYYPPIEPIGPMYLCWMLEKRLLKFANPAGEPRNLLLINNVREELFATKIEWHAGRPSTSDEARVYLFDALCAFWEKYFGKSTELSRFLFEKTLPYYSDFMKADTLPSKSAMTHDFVRYHTAVFSNELQQRISSVFSSMLKLKYDALSFALSIDPSCLNEFDGIQTKNETMDFLKNICEQCFREADKLIRLASNSKRKFKDNRAELIEKVYDILKAKTGLEDFKQLVFLNAKDNNIRCKYDMKYKAERMHKFYNWVSRLYDSIEFEWEIQISNKVRSEDSDASWSEAIKNELEADKVKFLVSAFVLFYSKAVKDEFFKELELISKKMFFYEKYSDVQYQRLIDFCV